MAGLGPANAGVKVPCLTTWLHPNIVAWPALRGKRRAEESRAPLENLNGVGEGIRTLDLRNHNPTR